MIYSMIIFEKIFFSAIFPPFSAYFIRHTALNGVWYGMFFIFVLTFAFIFIFQNDMDSDKKMLSLQSWNVST